LYDFRYNWQDLQYVEFRQS